LNESVKVAFASGSDDLIPGFLECVESIYPELPLYVVSEFSPPRGKWIPYHIGRTLTENLKLCRATLAGRRIRIAAVLLQPQMPFWRMRAMALRMTPFRTLFFNENLDHFGLRPRAAGRIAQHFVWRAKNFVRWHMNPGGAAHKFLWRLAHPREFGRPLMYRRALISGKMLALRKRSATTLIANKPADAAQASLAAGVSVVIPSRDGRVLLERLLPGLTRELDRIESEVIVVDNGSTDGTATFLRSSYPATVIEESAEPLSFAKAVNRGLARARFSHTLFLNNDMVLHEGFFAPLFAAFQESPDLFCATAQIFFPEGRRREETGKAMFGPTSRDGFPVRCEEPLEGEDHSYVLYGSGGCSLYDTPKARELGGFGELYEPAYVEDLDLGFRAWQRGWPTVFVAKSKVTHDHRATTSRFYQQTELDAVLEINYLRFLARCICSPELFSKLWRQAVRRLNSGATVREDVALAALKAAPRIAVRTEEASCESRDERMILALTGGDVAVFPGNLRRGREVVLVAAPYSPFPLSHGGAVRMYNLMRRAALEFDQVLVVFADTLAPPPPELLNLCAEIVLVRRIGSHTHGSSDLPDVVQDFSSLAYRAALGETVRKWKPLVAQLEFTQMAQYAADCAPAKTILVEHDITLDLYRQLLSRGEDWETRSQLGRWEQFEHSAWKSVDCVVAMSDKDRQTVTGARKSVALANGVDLERFRPSEREPDPARLLFIGSFGHLPNLLAVDFFLREVWPLLDEAAPLLHIIAGGRRQYYQEVHRNKVHIDLERPRIEVDDFVSDVRPAYERATLVIAPLLASAGTNIKIMEAMAMGKAIVTTPGGINGLDEIEDGRDVIVAPTGARMATEILELLKYPEKRRQIERNARLRVEDVYSWDVIAERQASLYRELSGVNINV
jgi:GT2 family glycosyltransferase/glycosyltransferase involved in cell wall biosynthesis